MFCDMPSGSVSHARRGFSRFLWPLGFAAFWAAQLYLSWKVFSAFTDKDAPSTLLVVPESYGEESGRKMGMWADRTRLWSQGKRYEALSLR